MNTTVMQDLETRRKMERSVFIARKIDCCESKVEQTTYEFLALRLFLLGMNFSLGWQEGREHVYGVVPPFKLDVTPSKQVGNFPPLLLIVRLDVLESRQS